MAGCRQRYIGRIYSVYVYSQGAFVKIDDWKTPAGGVRFARSPSGAWDVRSLGLYCV